MPEANDLTVGTMALVAQQECEAISRRTKEALAVAKARGFSSATPTARRRSEGLGKAARLRDAGFNEVRSKKLSGTIRFEEGEVFLRMNAVALLGMSAAGKTMDDQERKRVIEVIVNDSKPVARPHSEGVGLAFDLSTNLVTAKSIAAAIFALTGDAASSRAIATAAGKLKLRGAENKAWCVDFQCEVSRLGA